MTKAELFLELAKPDESGRSRWVYVSEFKDKYAELKFGNGCSWARKETKLAKKYIVEQDDTITPGNSTDRIRLAGYNDDDTSQYIRADIKRKIPEVDHKNGMKNESRVMKNENQKLSDFQPLSKAANDAKRQYCKECRASGKRFDAKLLGYPMSYYEGVAEHNGEEDACIGCYWYDPLEFKRHLVKRK